MAKKIISWKTKGMNRDMSVSAFNPEFAFENVNLRLSTNDGNTTMSWVNERGPRKLTLNIDVNGFNITDTDGDKRILGTPIGTAVLNHKLVVFSVKQGVSSGCFIYVFKRKDDAAFEGKVLYNGNLGFDVRYPIETLVSYESESIQKVYWTDGKKQPRVINIASTKKPTSLNDHSFDFVQQLQLRESVEVTKVFGSGEFPAGVIQYVFTYYNKHGQESNIFHTTPLQYISYVDRGGEPGSKIANSFRIKVSGVDKNFDYMRIYSILRTSKDATPLVKRVIDIPLGTGSSAQNAKGAMALSASGSNLDDFGKTMTVSTFVTFPQITKLNDSVYVQGAAAFGKYLFQAYIAGKYIDVIDLETNTRVATLETDIAYDFNAYHGNVLSFGDTTPSGSDFPYLYYSCESNSSPCILVIKILHSGSTWTGKVVSRIYLPKCNGGNSQSTNSGGDSDFAHYYQNGCVEAERGYIWVSGYTMASYNKDTGDYEGNKLIYRQYRLPSEHETDVYLSASNVISYITLPFKKGTQGMVIKDARLYQCFGYDQGDMYDEYLDCIDLDSGKIIKSYNFPKEQLEGKGEELESPYIYNDNLYLSATCNNWRYYTLWKISFNSDESGGVIVDPVDPIEPDEPDVPSGSGGTVSYVDDGLHGDTIDPTELLYKGGEEIVAETLEQKDETLFLGNLKVIRPSLINLKGSIRNSAITCAAATRYGALISRKPLSYLNTLSASNGKVWNGATFFKAREYYRLGVQFQYKNGKWSEPCWIDDVQQTVTPEANEGSGFINVPEFRCTLDSQIIGSLRSLGYRRARPVFAVPQFSDRTILCQGVGCPTVYKKLDRYADAAPSNSLSSIIPSASLWSGSKEGRLYAQSSWLFRTPINIVSPYYGDGSNGGGKVTGGGALCSHYGSGIGSSLTLNEVGNGDSLMYELGKVVVSPYLRNTEVMGIYDDGHRFYVDTSFATIHTPELIFDEALYSMDFQGCGMSCVGYVNLSNTYGDIDIQTSTPPIGSDSGGFNHRSIVTDGYSALIAGLFYNDYIVDDRKGTPPTYEAYHTTSPAVDFPVFMWHKNGSLNNDVARDNRSANLLKKRISNYRFGESTQYGGSTSYNVDDIQLFSSDELGVAKVNGHVYMGNIETLLTPTTPSPFYFAGYPYRDNVDTQFDSDCYYCLKLANPSDTESKSGVWEFVNKGGNMWEWDRTNKRYEDVGDVVKGLDQWREGISMKYKSTPHLVVGLNGSSIYSNAQYNQLPLVEVTKQYDQETFMGGTSEDALRENTWIPCGPTTYMEDGGSVTLQFKWGDTYFQRFECLKTYPFTPEDKNQVVEIASFMCETRMNIDGRYDRNRAQTSNLNITPQNFNLYNPVYSQMDNFFSYKMLDADSYKDTSYPNTVTWTKTKQNGADIDLWTNVTLANTLEFDGDKGEVRELTRLNNQLLAFQDSGISQILYNENTQISTTEGVPIEIANSQKVQGKRYFTDTVGCSNKWSMAQTPNGIYFMDSNEKSIYLFNGQLSNLSTMGGFNSWCKQNIPSSDVRWNPSGFGNFVTYYDKLNQDVLFINGDTALAYSEKFGCFTSFYDYGETPFFDSLDDEEIWIKGDKLWGHQAGEYCKFFDTSKPFSMTLVANQEPQVDKIFTNLEFRACVEGEGSYDEGTGKFTPSLPFDSLEAWDEYQHGITSLRNRGVKERMSHGTHDSVLARKFRTWACDIPRDNVAPDVSTEAPMGIKRFKARPLDRIRNTWAYIKLKKDAATDGNLSKIEVHDIVASYFA